MYLLIITHLPIYNKLFFTLEVIILAQWYNCKCKKRHKVGESCPNIHKYKYQNQTEHQKKQNQFYHTKRWIDKRESVKKMDKGVCQRCLIKHKIYTTEYLEVHHIKKLMSFWELRFDENNLITLCHTCHRQIELMYDGELDFEWRRNTEDTEYNIF